MSDRTSDKKYLALNDENFQSEVLDSPQPVLVDFWATWCPPCRAIAPTIERLAAEFDGVARVGKVDVDANQDLASRYSIQSIPALLFFKDGKVVDQVTGNVPGKMLADKLTTLTGVPAAEKQPA